MTSKEETPSADEGRRSSEKMADLDYKRLWLQACDAYDRKNLSGCVCAIDPDTDEIRSPCAMHAEWQANAVTAERERCAKVAEAAQHLPNDGKDFANGWCSAALQIAQAIRRAYRHAGQRH